MQGFRYIYIHRSSEPLRVLLFFSPPTKQTPMPTRSRTRAQPAPPTPTPTLTPMSAITSPRSSPSRGRGVPIRLASMRYDIRPILLPGPIRPLMHLLTTGHRDLQKSRRLLSCKIRDTRLQHASRMPHAHPIRARTPRTPARSSYLPRAPLGAEIPPPVFFVGATSASTFGHILPPFLHLYFRSPLARRAFYAASRWCKRPPVYARLCLRASESRWI
ncbi:hypothetical protein B0H11DRAFT_269639 [Mycena galericulata]|nr:hypothetical protein B0H11DRAFT_269639 [Mycena galericulata]